MREPINIVDYRVERFEVRESAQAFDAAKPWKPVAQIEFQAGRYDETRRRFSMSLQTVVQGTNYPYEAFVRVSGLFVAREELNERQLPRPLAVNALTIIYTHGKHVLGTVMFNHIVGEAMKEQAGSPIEIVDAPQPVEDDDTDGTEAAIYAMQIGLAAVSDSLPYVEDASLRAELDAAYAELFNAVRKGPTSDDNSAADELERTVTNFGALIGKVASTDASKAALEVTFGILRDGINHIVSLLKTVAPGSAKAD